MSEPSSFCTICTYTCHHELLGLLYSLSLHHPNAKIYCMIDTITKKVLDNLTLKPKLDIVTIVTLDKFTNLNRQEMLRLDIWNEFQMQKAEVIRFALKSSEDTLFIDSDVLFLNAINCIDKSKDIAVSPHFVKKETTDEVGYYNGGCIWTKNVNVCDDWIEFTKKSRYHDQASIEELVKKYSYSEFGEEINVMPWRIIVGEDPTYVSKSVNIQNNNIYYNDKPLVFVHTHFDQTRFIEFNKIIYKTLWNLKKYKELSIIDSLTPEFFYWQTIDYWYSM